MGTKRINDLADILSEKHDITKKQSKELVTDLFEEIKTAIGDGDRIVIRNFASLGVKERKPRRARNPRTGDVIFVPAKNAVRFKTSKNFKDYLQVASRNVLVITKDTGSFKDFLISNIEKIDCKPRIAETADQAFDFIFDKDLQIYSIIIDSTVPDQEARLLCNRVKMDETENIISIVQIRKDPDDADPEMLEILPDEVVYEPLEIDELMSRIRDEVNRIADERGYFSQQVKIRIPTLINEIEKTYDIMEDFFNKTNLEQEQIDELSNAYREAVGNAASHGNKNDENKNIYIDFVVDSKNLSFSIQDEGEGFDYAPFEKRADEASALDVARARIKLDNPGGMGMMIIKKCADEISYNAKGNKITVVKHLNVE